MLEKAILYIRMTKGSLTKRAGNGVRSAKRGSTNLANSYGLPLTICTACFLKQDGPL
jgi:hypothetical protein